VVVCREDLGLLRNQVLAVNVVKNLQATLEMENVNDACQLIHVFMVTRQEMVHVAGFLVTELKTGFLLTRKELCPGK